MAAVKLEPSADSNDQQMITVSDDGDDEEMPARTPAAEYAAGDGSAASSRSDSARWQHLSIGDVLGFLRANGLTAAESALRQESLKTKQDRSRDGFEMNSTTESINADASGNKPQGDGASIPELFRRLASFVRTADPSCSDELSTVLPTAFMHVQIDAIRRLRVQAVKKVYETYAPLLPQSLLSVAAGVSRDVAVLRRLKKPEDVRLHPIFAALVSNKYIVNMSKASYDTMKTLMLSRDMVELLRLLVDNMYFDTEDRRPRTSDEVLQNFGALLGEARTSLNKQKMFIGLPKELTADYVEEETPATTAGASDAGSQAQPVAETASSKRSKKRKQAAAAAAAAKKADLLGVRKLKLDQNAPEYRRIPLVPLAPSDKLDRVAAQKEYKKAIRISSNSLPSICFYTVLNSDLIVSSTTISNDSVMLACGFTSGVIKIWTLQNQRPLKMVKSHRELAKAPIESVEMELDDPSSIGTTGDLMLSDELMDPLSASDSKQLSGHTGAVLDLHFSPSRHWLLSAGQDGEIRLWSLLLWQCMTIYRGHVLCATSVCFSPPPALYFASGGFDRTVRIWSTEWPQAARICTGHGEDVTCVTFHPNCNYVASGSCDRTVRVWDVLDGSCCRMFTHHKEVVQSVQFSPCGQLLASGDQSGVVCLYKLSASSAALCATLTVSIPSHAIDAAIYSLAFSRDSNALAVGSGGYTTAVYMIERFPQQQQSEGRQQQQSAALAASLSSNIACAPVRLEPLTIARTKFTPVHHVHFSRRNLLLAAGPIER